MPGYTDDELLVPDNNGNNLLMRVLLDPARVDEIPVILKDIETRSPEEQRVVFTQLNRLNRNVLMLALADTRTNLVPALLATLIKFPVSLQHEIADQLNGMHWDHLNKLFNLEENEENKLNLFEAMLLCRPDKLELHVPYHDLPQRLIQIYQKNDSLHTRIEQLLINLVDDHRHGKDALFALILVLEKKNALDGQNFSDLVEKMQQYKEKYDGIDNPTYVLYDLYCQLKSQPACTALIKTHLEELATHQKHPESWMALAMIAQMENKDEDRLRCLAKIKQFDRAPLVQRFFPVGPNPVVKALLESGDISEKDNKRGVDQFLTDFAPDIRAARDGEEQPRINHQIENGPDR